MSDQCVSDNDKQTMKEMNGYAEIGDTGGLYRLIERDPYILQKIERVPFIRTPVHAAAAQGQTAFAIEVLGLLPSLGRKLDTRGHSPLHVALESLKKETILALVKFDRSLVRVRGAEGFTPLHYAARYYWPDLDVLSCFLLDCQESINDLTSRFQSAVHLVVESKDDKRIDLVLKWLVRTMRESVLERKDDKLNTALHLAAHHGCEEAVRSMVRIAKLNKRNSDDKTPLDVAIESGNDRVEKILKRARAKRAQHLTPKDSSKDYLCSGLNILETWVRGYSIMLKDLTIEMRSIVLIVAVLITTATYQAILQPPGGIFSGNPETDHIAIAEAPTSRSLKKSSKVGKMVMGESDYNQFMPANTVAFTLSMVTIIFVLHGRPYNVILHVCLVFVAYSYLIAMESISENESVAGIMFVLSWSLLSAAFGMKMAYYLVKALFQDVWWLPRCGVMWHNVANGRTVCVRCMAFARKLRRQGKLMLRLNKNN